MADKSKIGGDDIHEYADRRRGALGSGPRHPLQRIIDAIRRDVPVPGPAWRCSHRKGTFCLYGLIDGRIRGRSEPSGATWGRFRRKNREKSLYDPSGQEKAGNHDSGVGGRVPLSPPPILGDEKVYQNQAVRKMPVISSVALYCSTLHS
jgi:hypothetical protein